MALRDVMQHAVREQREITDPKPLDRRRSRRIVVAIVCVALLALSAYSWLARPEFIWGPSARSVPVERRDASLRFTMYLLARRIEAFRKSQGSYPASLDALGPAPAGISFHALGDSAFELRATNNGTPIVFRSQDAPDAFLRGSPRIIGGDAK